MSVLRAFRPGRPWCLVVSGLAIVLVPALLAQSAEASTPRGTALTARTAPSSWRIQNTPNPQVRDESFGGISCTSSSNCVAVGERLDSNSDQVTLAELWNGAKWKMMRTPNPVGSEQTELTSVSCASAQDCVAVGEDYGGHGVPVPMAESWDGTAWVLDSLPGDSPGFMNAVSCPSAGQCLAVGARFNPNGGLEELAADSWNGSTWERTKVVQPPENFGASLSSVSCPSEDSCEAVGSFAGDSEEGVTLAEIWNGTSWAIQKTPNPKGSSYSALSSVSCVSISYCVAVGLGSPITQPGPNTLGEIWNGTHWAIMSTPDPSGSDGTQLNAVSCSSATACAAVGENVVGSQEVVNNTLAMTWNGKTWTIEPSPTPSSAGGYLAGVVCNSASTCTGVGLSFGTKGPQVLLVETWNGTTWSIQRARGTQGLLGAGLSGVSCLSDSYCLAVGNDEFFDPVAEIWNGTNWKVTPAPVGEDGGTLDDVSCISTTDCISVGSPAGEGKGLAEEWNGASWTALATPAGQGVLEHISCTSATACMAVGITLSNTESSKPLAESWNGTQWTLTRIPIAAGSTLVDMQGVSCTSVDSCVAVGASLNQQVAATPLIYSWNGTKWTGQKSAVSSIGNLSLTGVSCASSTDCVAVGYTTDKLDSPGAFSEIWNGSTWASVKIPTPTGGAELSGIQCSSGTACVTVGTRSRGALAEGWDGTAWTVQKTAIPPGAGTSAAFEGLSCTSSISCTAVGSYSNTSGLQLTLAEAT